MDSLVRLKLNTERHRPVRVAWALFVKLSGSPNPHDGQLEAVACDWALRAESDCGLGNPGTSGDAVAGLEEISIQRKVVQHQLGFQRSKEVDACAWPARLGCTLSAATMTRGSRGWAVFGTRANGIGAKVIGNIPANAAFDTHGSRGFYVA